MPSIRDRRISLAILLLFTLGGTLHHLHGGDDLSSSYFGCQVLASGQGAHLYAHSAVDFPTVDDPAWQSGVVAAALLPPRGYIHPYVQTPLWAFLLRPACTHLSFHAFNVAFIAIVMLCTSAMLLLVLNFWTPILFRPLPVVLICVIFYRAEPLMYALALTQTHVIFLLCSLLAVLLAQSERPGRNRGIVAGALLAIAASIKITPGYLVLYWIARRQYTAALSFVAFFAALVGLTFLTTGATLTLAYLHELSELSNVLLVSSNNQSLAATWMTHAYASKDLLNWHIHRLPTVVKVTSLVLTIAASFAGGWLDRKPHRHMTPYGAIFAMVAATAFTPIAWTHYFVLLVVPVLLLVSAAIEDRRVPWALLGLAIAAFNIYPVGTDLFNWTAGSRFVIRPEFYTALISLIALWLLGQSDSRAGSGMLKNRRESALS
jgi:hypothetical protein